jgi:hypothetical protein
MEETNDCSAEAKIAGIAGASAASVVGTAGAATTQSMAHATNAHQNKPHTKFHSKQHPTKVYKSVQKCAGFISVNQSFVAK